MMALRLSSSEFCSCHSSMFLLHMREQQRLWQDCSDFVCRLFLNDHDRIASCIDLICPCNVDLITPHFYIVKLSAHGYTFSFSFCSKT